MYFDNAIRVLVGEGHIIVVGGVFLLFFGVVDMGFAVCVGIDFIPAEAEVVPRLGVGEHIPAYSVCAVFINGEEGFDGIAPAFGHFAACFIEDEAVGDYIFVSYGIEAHGSDGVEGIEPAACLVNAFGDEVGLPSVIFEEFLVLEGVMVLGVGHGTAIEPNVYKVEFAAHRLAVGRDENDIIDKGAMEVIGARLVEAERLVGFVDSGFEFGYGADANFLAAVGGAPDGEGDTPVARAGEVPILEVGEPVAEAAFACGGGLPVDSFIEFGHAFFDAGGGDEPRVEGVIEDGFVGTPAVGVIVFVLLDVEGFAFGF